jgi:hypothetical protein
MKSNLAIMALALIATSMLTMAATNSTGVPTFILYNSTTKAVNSTSGATLFIKSPHGFNMTLAISPGTYANISNTIYPSYNVTLSTFRTFNVPTPANATNDIVKSAFLFQINGKIIQAVAFVNKTGAPKSVTFTVNHGTNWTSWSYVNMSVNGTGYVYGAYSKQNKWIYNTTSGTMSDVTFEKAQMHVYELMPGPASNYVPTTTTIATTVATTTAATTSVVPTTVSTAPTTTVAATNSGSNDVLYAIVVIVVIVIIVIATVAYVATRKRKQ